MSRDTSDVSLGTYVLNSHTLSSTIFLNSHTLGCVIVKCRDIVFPARGHRPELMTVPSLATSLAGDPFVAATRGAAAEQIDTESRPT